METKKNLRRYSPVPFTQVEINDGFWSPRIEVNRKQTVPHQYKMCEETGRIDAFKLNWKPGDEPVPHIFWDSDVAKWIEAASYCLADKYDPALDSLLDEVTALVASAQQPDGYLNTHFAVVEPEKRWTNLRDWHELYCAGHMMEAGVAHYQATGKRTLLDAMCRYADYIDTVFGTEPGKKRGYCGHEEIELALVKLYNATGNEKYLRLSEYFVNERGRQPHYFDLERVERGEVASADEAFEEQAKVGSNKYNQSHVPVREQSEVVGHAVRAMYLYSAMADLAGETGDKSLLEACERLWENVCLKRMYVTGGIGPSRHNEGFTADYDLPNETAYAETCAAIGLVFWNWRLLQLECDSRFSDVVERALYNGVLSGASLDGRKFFYENPLASNGNHHRQEWFGCACCPPNFARIIASLGSYIYSHNSDSIAVHLYVQSKMSVELPEGGSLSLEQSTNYPWDGAIKIKLSADRPVKSTLRLRIPGWCRSYTIKIGGQEIIPSVGRGYACIERVWQDGDCVELDLAMPVERVAAHPNVAADRGRVALQRGPLVYCIEDADNPAGVDTAALPCDAEFSTVFSSNMLEGVVVIEGDALFTDSDDWESSLYRNAGSTKPRRTRIRAIPYYAWDNRSPGRMVVWIPLAPQI